MAMVVASPGRFCGAGSAAAGEGCGQAEPAELAAKLPWRSPERGPGADGDRAERVDRDQRADRQPVVENRRGRAEPALQPLHRRPGPGPGGAKREIATRRRQRPPPEIAVRVDRPGLVATIQQIEEDRRRHDRHILVADRKAAPGGAQRIGDAGCRVKPERRAPRKHQRIDLLHQPVGGKQVGLAGAGRTAHDMHRGGEGRIGDQHRHARAQAVILGIADREPGDIGDQVSWSRSHRRLVIMTRSRRAEADGSALIRARVGPIPRHCATPKRRGASAERAIGRNRRPPGRP